jgi:hypothetical protein
VRDALAGLREDVLVAMGERLLPSLGAWMARASEETERAWFRIAQWAGRGP